MSSLRLFEAFSPPPFRPSPYTYAPSKRRWLPLLAAFGCGAVCVLAISAWPASRAYVKPPLRVYASPEVALPDSTFLAVAQPRPGQLPAKAQESRPLTQEDQADDFALAQDHCRADRRRPISTIGGEGARDHNPPPRPQVAASRAKRCVCARLRVMAQQLRLRRKPKQQLVLLGRRLFLLFERERTLVAKPVPTFAGHAFV